jgi:hypothetical protein
MVVQHLTLLAGKLVLTTSSVSVLTCMQFMAHHKPAAIAPQLQQVDRSMLLAYATLSNLTLAQAS